MNTPDGPLHDFAGEAVASRAEMVDALVELWAQDADETARALAAHETLADDLANLMDYSDEYLGARVRLIVSRALTARAEREIDA